MVEGLRKNSRTYKNDSVGGVSGKLMSSLFTGVIETNGFSGTSASILLTFANPDFSSDITLIDSTVPRKEPYFINTSNQCKKNINVRTFDFSKQVKIARILGLIGLISYMIVILFTWMFANLQGYVYFSAGEPVLSIKYPEWILGFLGILVAADYLHMELNDDGIY